MDIYAAEHFTREARALKERCDELKEKMKQENAAIRAAEKKPAEPDIKEQDDKYIADEKAKRAEHEKQHEAYMKEAHKEVEDAGISAAVQKKIEKYQGAKQ